MTNNISGYFSTSLTLIFITLKLTGIIEWSWWFVLGPLWIPFAIIVLVFAPIWLIYTVIQAKRAAAIQKAQVEEEYSEIMSELDGSEKH
tara:strand:+ start:1381 stop:1647 length:267 start_codon:yes stop_codon:yes gene_type:complete